MNWSCKRRAAAATSTGAGVAFGLLWVREEVESVEIWESWLKKEDMSGRRFWLTGLSLMLCSTGTVVLTMNRVRGGGWVMDYLRRGSPL